MQNNTGQNRPSKVEPLLFRSATRRIPGSEMPGRYDHDRSVWVVGEPGSLRAIVEADEHALLEITTKTKVTEEVDDEQNVAGLAARPDMLELVTKTMVQQEADDEVPPARFLLELETKTEAQVESDDQTRPVL